MTEMSEVRVFAPGSMTHLMPRLIQLFQGRRDIAVHTTYGPSGSLRAQIEAGAPFDVFLSASLTHADALREAGLLQRSDVLGFNAMVLLYQSELRISPDEVLSRLIDPSLSVGMSTTGLDPSNAAGIEIVEKISQASGVGTDHLIDKIRMITGGRESPNAPEGRNQYGWLMENEGIQLLLTYLSNALAAMEDNPNLRFTQLPSAIAVTGTYGIGLASGAQHAGLELFEWLIAMDAQRILNEGGFQSKHAAH